MTTATTVRRWTDLAACKGADDDVMFPANGTPEYAKPGKALCVDCPVAQQCLDLAMKFEAGHGTSRRFGVYGGLSSHERWKRDRVRVDPPTTERRGGRDPAPCGTPAAIARHRRHREVICDTCRTAEEARKEQEVAA